MYVHVVFRSHCGVNESLRFFFGKLKKMNILMDFLTLICTKRKKNRRKNYFFEKNKTLSVKEWHLPPNLHPTFVLATHLHHT